jgi:hypothetical protein
MELGHKPQLVYRFFRSCGMRQNSQLIRRNFRFGAERRPSGHLTCTFDSRRHEFEFIKAWFPRPGRRHSSIRRDAGREGLPERARRYTMEVTDR